MQEVIFFKLQTVLVAKVVYIFKSDLCGCAKRKSGVCRSQLFARLRTNVFAKLLFDL